MAGFFKASEAANLALHSMVILSVSDNKPLTNKHLASVICASGNHLSKVLLSLVKAGLVKSSKGPGGGFILAKPSDSIFLIEIYEAIEGKLKETGCFFSIPACDGNACLLGPFTVSLNSELINELSTTRLSELRFRLDALKTPNIK